MTQPDSKSKQQPGGPWFRLATELGPLVLFFVANAKFSIFVATGVFMAAIVVALAASWIVTRHLPAMAIVSAVLVLVFGGLTLILRDETFIKIKPTIIYAGFAAILVGGLLRGRSLLSLVFSQAFQLDAEGWRLLTWRWAGFFVVMAVLNEIIWRTQSTETWLAFKAFGVLPLTLVFVALQWPLMQRHALDAQGAEALPKENGAPDSSDAPPT